MFTFKIRREVTSGDVYKLIFPYTIKHLCIKHNPMAVAKKTNEKVVGTYQIAIKTIDRKEYNLTKETFNYNSVLVLYKLLEIKLGFQDITPEFSSIIEKLSEKNKLFFSKVCPDCVIYATQLQNTLDEIEKLNLSPIKKED